ncbi:ribonuclease H-like superfamily protein [Striga asiatica]|uniref:Ribonuclease H-like superfamily protein n=1 Tax=Striga asiatica TaxID=4170 RepID=A0A5A7RAI2_STRAF|nr:ribonuclease H-like superfamily protein [Striga asiatica]
MKTKVRHQVQAESSKGGKQQQAMWRKMWRGMNHDVICHWCGSHEEDLEHILFRCERAQRSWRLAGYPCLHISCGGYGRQGIAGYLDRRTFLQGAEDNTRQISKGVENHASSEVTHGVGVSEVELSASGGIAFKGEVEVARWTEEMEAEPRSTDEKMQQIWNWLLQDNTLGWNRVQMVVQTARIAKQLNDLSWISSNSSVVLDDISMMLKSFDS